MQNVYIKYYITRRGCCQVLSDENLYVTSEYRFDFEKEGKNEC